MLRLLVDTSTWLDLAKRRDGQKWIVAIRLNVQWGNLALIVPKVVIEEFERNRARIEAAMTASVNERFRQMRQDFTEYGGEHHQEAIEAIENLAHQVPLIGAMSTRNFDDILALLKAVTPAKLSAEQAARVVQRGLDNRAPLHRQGNTKSNSVADAVLIELYASAVAEADISVDQLGFVTSNSKDFSLTNGDQRVPHADIAAVFGPPSSSYWLGVDGLNRALEQAFGEEYEELLAESDFREDPRRLDEIMAAESELFDRIWYNRSLSREYRLAEAGDQDSVADLQRVAGPGRQRVEAALSVDALGPYDDFEWGMLNGKLSALRWVLGSEWDFLDT